jgi:putative transposase
MGVDRDRWTYSNTSVHNLGYHIIWCTKYRRKLLNNDIQNRLKQLIASKCNELDVELCTMETMPEHIHIFIKSKPTLAPHYIIKQIKGFSSKKLREEFPVLKSKIPTLWTRSYYVESVGCISEETINKYIENQKNK